MIRIVRASTLARLREDAASMADAVASRQRAEAEAGDLRLEARAQAGAVARAGRAQSLAEARAAYLEERVTQLEAQISTAVALAASAWSVASDHITDRAAVRGDPDLIRDSQALNALLGEDPQDADPQGGEHGTARATDPDPFRPDCADNPATRCPWPYAPDGPNPCAPRCQAAANSPTTEKSAFPGQLPRLRRLGEAVAQPSTPEEHS